MKDIRVFFMVLFRSYDIHNAEQIGKLTMSINSQVNGER